MGRIVYIVVLIFCFGNTQAQKALDTNPSKEELSETKFEFDKTYIELGEVKKGEKRSFQYTMTNTGKKDINIEYVSYCDCTEVEYDKFNSLKPGKSMIFDVVFDSSTKEEEETIQIEIELKNIDNSSGLPYYFTLDYHFIIVK